MDVITKDDLVLVNKLSTRNYSNNKLLSNATEEEKRNLASIKKKLKNIAEYYANKYRDSYGEFESSVSTGNDIAIGGTKFKRIWSGIFKGASNKQYAAQISFVMDPEEPCLNVGFYFGRASGHSKDKAQREELGGQLQELATCLADTIDTNQLFRERYNSLLDFGFKTYSDSVELTSEQWRENIRVRAKSSQIFAKIFTNDFNVIENSTLDSYVAQIIFLMAGISLGDNSRQLLIKPLSAEQRAKQAERNAEIGLKGELHVMETEKKKIDFLGLHKKGYPRHVALESMHYGYDIISLDEKGNELLIEVKTTTRLKSDRQSKIFFMSTNEFEVSKKNMKNYVLYRVYDAERNPEIEIVNLKEIEMKSDGYICKYR